MRLCPCRKVPFVKRQRMGIEARNLVPVHDRNIDITIRSRRRITVELGCWHLPLADLSLNLWPTPWRDTIVRPASPDHPGYEQNKSNDNALLYVWHGAIAPSPLCSRDSNSMEPDCILV